MTKTMCAIRYFGILLVSFSHGIALGIFSFCVAEIMGVGTNKPYWFAIFLISMLLTTCAFFLLIKHIADKRRYWLYGALIVLDFFIFTLVTFVLSGLDSAWLVIFFFPAFLSGLIGGSVIIFSKMKWLIIFAVPASIIAFILWFLWLLES
ncbi:hypothetical protein CQA49_07295 [Helicobacter sp. MIT 00-7814]|uniref:hypothetical protein n=1 Tax=unclassified Helicobacter TaxID=2593540 RepID=UPI000E1F9E36|nr:MULTISPECIES: hypothetical protein [unclassified Helicobacter]RDU52958.1 hypothetical protein CQA49_07295 [Helicobacter sp. MIT 00-7814]RDU53882.1 hypothetical protein CQA37_06545 [Helicobacter sp. MIT 99-10781]